MKEQIKILIIDDSATNNLLVSNILSSEEGFNVLTANSAKVGLEIIAKEDYISLILLDIMMPVTDGFQMLEILKKDPDTRDIPVIIVSAKIKATEVNKGLELGAIDYIKKPIIIKDLLEKINSII